MIGCGITISASSKLGPELVANGDFSAGVAGWEGLGVGTGWNIVDNKAVHSAGTYGSFRRSTATAAGKKYILRFSLQDRTVSSIYVYSGGVRLTDIPIGTNKIYDYSFVATNSNASIIFEANASFNGSVDNVSLRELLWS